jgi:hypothetical protein
LITRSAAQHQLHYLDLPDDCCKARLHARNQSGEFAWVLAGKSSTTETPAVSSVSRCGVTAFFSSAALITRSAAQHQLHYLDLPDDCCKARLHARNQSGEHLFPGYWQENRAPPKRPP